MDFLKFSLFACHIALSLADVQVQIPTAGATYTGGSLQVSWNESAVEPYLYQLTSCQLSICAGGNQDSDSLQLLELEVITPPFAPNVLKSYYFNPGIGGDISNAYFLKFVCAVSTGGIVIDFSNRFSLSGMTGVFPTNVVQAMQSLAGTNGPERINSAAVVPSPVAATTQNVASSSSVTSTASVSSETAYTTFTSTLEYTTQITSSISTGTTLVAVATTSFETVTVTNAAQYSSMVQAQHQVSSASPTSTSSPNLNHSRPLSSTSEAIIGICIALFLMLAGILAFFILRRRRSRFQPRQPRVRMPELKHDLNSPKSASFNSGTLDSPTIPFAFHGTASPTVPVSKSIGRSSSPTFPYGLAGIRYHNGSISSLRGSRSQLELPAAPSPAASSSPRSIVYGAKFPLPVELSDPSFYEGRPSAQGWFQRAELESRDCVVVADVDGSIGSKRGSGGAWSANGRGSALGSISGSAFEDGGRGSGSSNGWTRSGSSFGWGLIGHVR